MNIALFSTLILFCKAQTNLLLNGDFEEHCCNASICSPANISPWIAKTAATNSIANTSLSSADSFSNKWHLVLTKGIKLDQNVSLSQNAVYNLTFWVKVVNVSSFKLENSTIGMSWTMFSEEIIGTGKTQPLTIISPFNSWTIGIDKVTLIPVSCANKTIIGCASALSNQSGQTALSTTLSPGAIVAITAFIVATAALIVWLLFYCRQPDRPNFSHAAAFRSEFQQLSHLRVEVLADDVPKGAVPAEKPPSYSEYKWD